MSESGIPVVVKPNTPTVYKLWSEAQGIMHMVNVAMLLFLRLFCIYVYHAISCFLVTSILRRSPDNQWRNSCQKRKTHRIDVTLFVVLV